MTRIAEAFVDIDARTGRLEQGLKRSVRATDTATARMAKDLAKVASAVGALGVAFFATATRIAAAGDQIGKTAERLGLTAEALQELRFAAERSGVATNTLDMALQRMVRRVAEAAQGTGEASAALKELGIDARQLNSLSPDEQLRRIAEAFANVNSHADQVRLAFKLFDSEGVALIQLLNEGADGIDELTERARELGGVMSNEAVANTESFTDALTDLKEALKGLSNEVATGIIPQLERMIRSLTRGISKAKEFASEVFAGLNITPGPAGVPFISLKDPEGQPGITRDELERLQREDRNRRFERDQPESTDPVGRRRSLGIPASISAYEPFTRALTQVVRRGSLTSTVETATGSFRAAASTPFEEKLVTETEKQTKVLEEIRTDVRQGIQDIDAIGGGAFT